MSLVRHLAATVFALLLAMSTAGAALDPNEILDDPALEQRARDLSANLRCMVCQNQSIDDSNAELARDLRVLVRERLLAGDSNEEVIDYVVSRYGEFVLLKPRFSLRNAALWGAPALILFVGGTFLLVTARRRPAVSRRETELSTEEKRQLDDILGSGS